MKVGKKAYVSAVFGSLVLMLAGVVYSWSVISKPIAEEFPQWSAAQLSLTFTLTMIMFCLGCLVAGVISKKLSAKVLLIISAALFAAGFAVASQAHSLAGLYISYGVICGAASGIAYNAVLSTVTKCFPHKHGVISGVLLMCFGIGSFIIGKIFAAVVIENAFPWRYALIALGGITAAVIIVSAFFVKPPSEAAVVSSAAKKPGVSAVEDIPPKKMLQTPKFWLYFLWTIFLSASGLIIVSQAGKLVTDINSAVSGGTLSTMVGMISIFNGVGRIISGFLYDRLGRRATMQIVNIAFVVTAVITMLAIKSSIFWLLAAAFVIGGLSYGGVTPVNSAFAAGSFGMKHYSVNFSIINVNLLIASFGSTLSGSLYDASGSFFSSYLLIGCLAVAGVLLSAGISLCERRSGKNKASESAESL